MTTLTSKDIKDANKEEPKKVFENFAEIQSESIRWCPRCKGSLMGIKSYTAKEHRLMKQGYYFDIQGVESGFHCLLCGLEIQFKEKI